MFMHNTHSLTRTCASQITHSHDCRYLQYQLPSERRARCYFFNTFFYTKLSEKRSKAAAGSSAEQQQQQQQQQQQPAVSKERAGHARVMKWMKVWVRIVEGCC